MGCPGTLEASAAYKRSKDLENHARVGDGGRPMIEALISLALCVGFFVMLPIVLVGAALKLVLALVVLPFKILGVALKLVFGAIAAVISTVSALGILLIGLLFLIALPLLPLLLLAGFVWALFKAFSPTPAIVR
jgi:hypothetical protein